MITAYILPTYNESSTLPVLLKELINLIKPNDIVVVADDSELEEQKLIQLEIRRYQNVYFSPGKVKAGRGAAVFRGMMWILSERSEVTHIVEADCDGSHRIDDIIAIASCDDTWDFVIGSRYLPRSKIRGWSNSRKTLSYFLNKAIPKILSISCTDITNGLRRYSINAASVLTRSVPTTAGFIYLSEQAYILREAKIQPVEIPIIFESRIAGRSSVTSRDLFDSLVGLINIVAFHKRNKRK
jgi:dolichol-phosphate mannosyltransferase